MTQPVYSAPLIYFVTGTPFAQWTVPPNFTAVIRHCSFVQNIGDWSIEVFITAPGSNKELVLFHKQAASLGSFLFVDVQVDGPWVVPDGYTIYLNASSVGSQASGYVGGYLLSGTIPQEHRTLLDAQFELNIPLAKDESLPGKGGGLGLKQSRSSRPRNRPQRQA